MRHTALLLVLLLGSFAENLRAQWYGAVYRPPGVQYRVLPQTHFELIYQVGRESEARELAALLEAYYDSVRAFVGVQHAFRVPVILSDYQDVGNGFVSALPYRQEITVSRLRGLRVAPSVYSWPHAVAPHELVHAAHAEVNAGMGIGWGLRLLGPDWSRLLNLWAPAGFAEGVAVYYESQIPGGAGRLRFPFFTMEFRAAMAARRPWRLAQLLEAPAYTWPFDRHYNGGGHLVQYLFGQGRADFLWRTTRWFHRMPLLGFGAALWYGTRQVPWELGQHFRQEVQAQVAAALARRAPFTEMQVVRSERGLIIRRPYWLDARTLVAYVRGYQERPGYYRFDVESGRMKRVRTFDAPEDVRYALTPDRQALLVARYVPDPLLSGRLTAEVYRLELNGRVQRLTHGGRVYAPVMAPDGSVWALQNQGFYNQWVRITPSGQIEPVMAMDRVFFLQLAPDPWGRQVAVLLHYWGRQGIFRAQRDAEGRLRLQPWLAFRTGAIYDLSWSADGRWLLFTADPDSVPNIYALEVETGRVLRLTNVPFGALEAALSPDSRWLAFIHYRHERYELVRMPFQPERAVEVPADWLAPIELAPAVATTQSDGVQASATHPYRAWRYLWRPRLVYMLWAPPEVRNDRFGDGLSWAVGLGLEGADPLQRWSYRLHSFYRQGYLWGSLWLAYGGWPFRPGLFLYDLPSSALVRLYDPQRRRSVVRRVGRERRGVALSATLPVLLESNIYTSWLLLTLQSRYEYERFFWHTRPGQPTLADDARTTLEPIVTLAYRLQQNWRDLMPNQGLSWTTRMLWDLSRTDFPLRATYWSSLYGYVPILARYNVGIRLEAGLLWQNRGAIYDLTRFLPRGWDDIFLDRGLFGRLGILTLVPLKFVDNGFVLLPLYIEALYLYGFAEAVRPFRGARAFDKEGQPVKNIGALGGGLGAQFRIFSHLRLDLRVGMSYRVSDRRWRRVWR
ncbi:TolB family protein [Rhodothermus profundi]|uniref:WD40-like Beta Propeller Repeat n=1 Tax=Rhodothermus profundi TaxID=633813 RepID=A0A1M6SZA4_9BACT|nr:PD40 domain-containing protein [Rhodothermus profundi]SHK50041.1 WD40-like Beta Propeller Repeat [Rhodothermus profundi]